MRGREHFCEARILQPDLGRARFKVRASTSTAWPSSPLTFSAEHPTPTNWPPLKPQTTRLACCSPAPGFNGVNRHETNQGIPPWKRRSAKVARRDFPSQRCRWLALVPSVGDDGYHQLRPRIAICEKESIKLNDRFGLNPLMNTLRPALDAGALTIIHCVGSDHDTRSHFEAQVSMEHGGQAGGGRGGAEGEGG